MDKILKVMEGIESADYDGKTICVLMIYSDGSGHIEALKGPNATGPRVVSFDDLEALETWADGKA